MMNTNQCRAADEENQKAIPDEHKEISAQIMLIRNLVGNSPVDVSQIISALRELLKLTKSHFEHEEYIMITNHFPGMLLHKRDHDYLVDGLRKFMASLVDETAMLSPQIADNLQSWLNHHIKKFDDAYLEFRALSGSPET